MSSISGLQSPLQLVRKTCGEVCRRPRHVKIRQEGIENVVKSLNPKVLDTLTTRKYIDADLHFMDNSALTVQYLFVLDAINFCFWPDGQLQYNHLAQGLKAAVEKDSTVLEASKLLKVTGDDVQALMGWSKQVPLQNERARLINEVGEGLLSHFGGEAANLVGQANCSVAKLVDLVTRHFPGFRDHAVYSGQQVFLYKRAQIFAGDVWGAFGGEGLGRFDDIHDLTMFADYRVPVVLRHLGILEYTQELGEKIKRQEGIMPSSEEEVEIRCSSIMSVEYLKDSIEAAHGRAHTPHSVQLDWWLWESGEADRANHPPHHRTLTIFY